VAEKLFGGPENDLSTLWRGSSLPLLLGRSCRRYRLVDILFAGGGDGPYDIGCVSRVYALKGRLRGRLHPFAVDKVLKSRWHKPSVSSKI
jgi:hypothetical protein